MRHFQSENGGRDRGREANCVFQTSLDFEKNKALLNLSMYFSKITYHRLYLGNLTTRPRVLIFTDIDS